MHIQFFDGSLERFIAGLDRKTAAKVLHTIDLLERFGNQLGMPHSKHIGHRLFELRIKGKQEVRLLYAFRKEKIIILHGFIKKSRRTPPREIITAERRLKTLDGI